MLLILIVFFCHFSHAWLQFILFFCILVKQKRQLLNAFCMQIILKNNHENRTHMKWLIIIFEHWCVATDENFWITSLESNACLPACQQTEEMQYFWRWHGLWVRIRKCEWLIIVYCVCMGRRQRWRRRLAQHIEAPAKANLFSIYTHTLCTSFPFSTAAEKDFHILQAAAVPNNFILFHFYFLFDTVH